MTVTKKAPCQNCPNRQKPKTCEGECELWKEYKKEYNTLSKKIYLKKKLEKRLNDSRFRGIK